MWNKEIRHIRLALNEDPNNPLANELVKPILDYVYQFLMRRMGRGEY